MVCRLSDIFNLETSKKKKREKVHFKKFMGKTEPSQNPIKNNFSNLLQFGRKKGRRTGFDRSKKEKVFPNLRFLPYILDEAANCLVTSDM
jgi:hypothetical protein